MEPAEIQCDCGQFKAVIRRFPRESAGRLGCYCDDCQAYAAFLGRPDILDAAGCTEVVPVYPQNLVFTQGASLLQCTRLSPKGTFRWSTACCNSPIANTKDGMPWAGVFAQAYTRKDPGFLDKTTGPVQSRIMGKFAKTTPAPGTPDTFNLRALAAVIPFVLKGKLFGKAKGSPFFQSDGHTPIHTPYVLSQEERRRLTPSSKA